MLEVAYRTQMAKERVLSPPEGHESPNQMSSVVLATVRKFSILLERSRKKHTSLSRNLKMTVEILFRCAY
ncbi:unnamed protein product [Cylicocyclus nassatus]|uniref:Uncharacterized protein n=1 Tax=Cylicocyclus nassatus TaxID=53992 RepID=A0AA36DPU9_CYLNA|nr:unnamed protein product [Cylicocyclus nassatus]